jgi:hypothetical protein
MSLRNKKTKKALTAKEIHHLRLLHQEQSLDEMENLSPEHAKKMTEEKVFFKKGDAKGKVMAGGENQLVQIAPDNVDGTATYIEYTDKHGKPAKARTQITSDKRLLDENGNLIRELY